MNNIKSSIPPTGQWVTKRKGPLWALLCVLLAMVVFGVMLLVRSCGGAAVQTPSVSPTPETTAIAQPVKGGSLSIPMPQNPATYNPLKASSTDMVSIGWLIHESLLKYDDAGRIVNGVAESYTTTDGGKTWTFKIKNGITWHKGGNLTAHDVLYSYGLILSYADQSMYRDKLVSRVENIQVMDDQTLVVTAKEGGHSVLDALCYPILSQAYASGKNLDSAVPNGTGPYTVAEMNAAGMTLKVNEGWWKQRAYLDTLQVVAVPDNASALTAYQAGQLNMVPTQSLTADRYAKASGTNIHSIATQNFECLVPNFRNSLLGNGTMRQALTYALEIKDVVDRAFLGHAVTVDTPIMPGNFLFDSGAAETYEYKPKKAGDLLDSLGWTLPADATQKFRVNAQGQILQFRILVNENTESTVRRDMAQTIKEQLAKAGINVVLDVKKWAQYQSALASGDYDLALLGYNVDRSQDLRTLLYTGGSLNYSRYSSAEMDQLLNDFAKSTDEMEMKKKMSEIQRLVSKDLPVISLCFRSYTLLSDDSIKNVEGLFDRGYYNNIERWYVSQ